MPTLSSKLKDGHHSFKKKYAEGSHSIIKELSENGQKPEIMVVSCSDSRVDPALILQCNPGDLFVVRNVANIIPPYCNNHDHHGVSTALEYGVRYLKVSHLIIISHSQCGGIQALMDPNSVEGSDFISDWMSSVKPEEPLPNCANECAKIAMQQSHKHCLGFPWIKERLSTGELSIHRWFFDITDGSLSCYDEESDTFMPFDGKLNDT